MVFVCWYLKHVKTAEPIWSKNFVDLHDPREDLWMFKISKINIQQNFNPLNFKNPRIFFEIFLFLFVWVLNLDELTLVLYLDKPTLGIKPG